MRYIFTFLALLLINTSFSQKLKKADKLLLANLKTHVTYLADDKLEGRRTGTPGEKLAYEYILSAYEKAGLTPKGDNGTWLQQFEVNEGLQVDPSSHLIINGSDLKIHSEYFPLSFSPDITLEALPVISLPEHGNPWFWDLKDVLLTNQNNPHFDLQESIKSHLENIIPKGATALIIYNTSALKDDLSFTPKPGAFKSKIPVIYLSKESFDKYLHDDRAGIDIKLKVSLSEKVRKGHNVIGYLDNGAANTIVIGAHYDHLGYGEDKNSLHSGGSSIHNGADDNASGTAAIIELARLIKASPLKRYNFLFISFSGEELGLHGSKYFTEKPSLPLSKVNYMLNLDMVGRLNDSSKSLTVGGYGTSPSWGSLITSNAGGLNFRFDSSGTGPSDHTSFYRKDIPVLFFFTGIHGDYHKPGDDVEKINFMGQMQIVKFIYKLLEETNKIDKLAFTKTREVQMGSTRFTVSLGIMPDYTYSGDGVRVDGLSEGKLAQRLGIKAGDVIFELGGNKFHDVQTYMKALSKFKKGDATTLKLKRGVEELMFEFTF